MFKEFIKGISFGEIQPHTPSKGGGAELELSNTVFSVDDQAIKEGLRDLLAIPRMSTLAIGGMINRCVALLTEDQAYVNVGVWHGFTFLCGVVGNEQHPCIGIDNFSQFGSPRNAFLERFEQYKTQQQQFYDMDYEEYFQTVHKTPIGLYIYDGEHSYANQLKGLQLAEPFFAENCIVMVDDTNWAEPRQATLDFIAASSYDYDILFDVTTCGNGHPTFWNGLMVLQRK